MTPIEPTPREGERSVTFAKDQPEYDPLPACINDEDGLVVTVWEPTADELRRLMCGGHVRLIVHTFGDPLQPLRLDVLDPECGMRES